MANNRSNVKKYKLCRRLGAGVFEKCQTQKFLLAQGAPTRSSMRRSDFGLQLIEKQKVRFMYGLGERQFRNYVDKAMESTQKGKTPVDSLNGQLEHRLDNVVYRLGLANSRALSRQMVSHGHITVNGKKMTIPSYQTVEGDVISIREGSRKSPLFADLDVKLKNHKTPDWLGWQQSALTGTVRGEPREADAFLNMQAVIEFYSR